MTNCPRGVEKHRWFAYFSQLAQGVLLNVHVVKSNQHSPYFDRYFEEALKEQIKFVKARWAEKRNRREGGAKREKARKGGDCGGWK